VHRIRLVKALESSGDSHADRDIADDGAAASALLLTGNPAISDPRRILRPEALRPRLAAGLPLTRASKRDFNSSNYRGEYLLARECPHKTGGIAYNIGLDGICIGLEELKLDTSLRIMSLSRGP
jgi:hypothetical protein